MAGMSYVVPLRAGAMPAWLHLQAVLESIDGRTPCRVDPEAWSGENTDPDVTEWCEFRCRSCPALEACDRYAAAARERHGVWGGLNRATKAGRPPAERRTA
jgi:Transcription factor WhiB